MLWLLAQQCVETWQIFRNFNLFLVISFEYIYIILEKKDQMEKKSPQKKIISVV
jgi:hypothetical protein